MPDLHRVCNEDVKVRFGQKRGLVLIVGFGPSENSLIGNYVIYCVLYHEKFCKYKYIYFFNLYILYITQTLIFISCIIKIFFLFFHLILFHTPCVSMCNDFWMLPNRIVFIIEKKRRELIVVPR